MSDTRTKKTLVREFTSGSIPKSLLIFMLPFMASNAFQVLYSAVDMIIVGRYVGSAGLSAVSICGQMMNFVGMLSTGICTGGQVLIAQLIGAGKKRQLGEVIGTLATFIMLLAVAASALTLIFHRQILGLLNTPQEAFAYAVHYMLICGVGLIFTFGYNMVSAILRGMGDSRHPFLFITIASVTNLILDLLFTGRLGWGVAGAAAATIIGQAVSFLFSLIFLYRHRDEFSFELTKSSFRLHREYIRTILAQGLPLACSSSAVYFSMFYVNSMINRLGVTASAAFGIGLKIDDLCNKVSIGIRYAATPMIAQNYAAKNLGRVKKTVYWSWIYGFIMHIGFMLIYMANAKPMFSIFTSDVAVLDLAPLFVRYIKWIFVASAILRGSNAFIQGIGFSKLSMALGLLDGVVFRIGLSYLFGTVLGMGFAGYVLGYGLAPFGAGIPGAVYFLSGIWKGRKSLVEQIG